MEFAREFFLWAYSVAFTSIFGIDELKKAPYLLQEEIQEYCVKMEETDTKQL